jgi:hypothetical protein
MGLTSLFARSIAKLANLDARLMRIDHEVWCEVCKINMPSDLHV